MTSSFINIFLKFFIIPCVSPISLLSLSISSDNSLICSRTSSTFCMNGVQSALKLSLLFLIVSFSSFSSSFSIPKAPIPIRVFPFYLSPFCHYEWFYPSHVIFKTDFFSRLQSTSFYLLDKGFFTLATLIPYGSELHSFGFSQL